MNEKIKELALIILLFLTVFMFFDKADVLSASATYASKIFLTNIFPFLFSMMVVNNLLFNLNFPYYFTKLFKNIYLYLLIMSFLSGAPANATLIKSFLDKKYINKNDANITLCFTTINSPLFLYNYLYLISGTSKQALIIILSIYLAHIIIFIFSLKKLNISKFVIKRQKVNFSKAFIDAIKKAINTMIMVYASVIFFKLVCDLFVQTSDLAFLKGFVEITQGLNFLANSNYIFAIKIILSILFICFGGFCIHIQISSILKDYDIDYKPFYLSRLFLFIISIILWLSIPK